MTVLEERSALVENDVARRLGYPSAALAVRVDGCEAVRSSADDVEVVAIPDVDPQLAFA